MDALDRAILEAIRKGAESMRQILPELERVDHESSQPTVSRRLQALVSAQRVRRIGGGRATRYVYDDWHDYFAVPGNLRPAVGYDPDLIESYVPNETRWFSSEDVVEMTAAGANRAVSDASTYSRAIAQKLLVDLSYASSAMEGNTYSYIDTEVLVQYGKEAIGKAAAETQMILNHKEAINYIVDNIEEIGIDSREVKTMHSMLSYGLIDPRQIGSVRQHIVGVGNSAYVPLSIPARLDDELEKIADKASLIDEPFERSLFLMVAISYLQYFVDVNKRTGRLMANVPLLKAGYAPLSFLNIDKEEYTRGLLTFYELKRPDVIAAAYRRGYIASASRYDAYASRDLRLIQCEARYRVEIRQMTKQFVLDSLRDGEKPTADFFLDVPDSVATEDRTTVSELVRVNTEGMHEGNHRVFGIGRAQFDEFRTIGPDPSNDDDAGDSAVFKP